MTAATRAIHADDFFSTHKAIAPGMHTAVNYRYHRDPELLVPMENTDRSSRFPHLGRYTHPNTTRFESILKTIFGGEVLTYSTGLSAFNAIMMLLTPKRVFIGDGYHGVHRSLKLQKRLKGVESLPLEELDKAQAGDLVHIETPVNPFGEARNLAYYTAKAREKGAYISVDGTFAPPPLQDPLAYGVDFVLHSGTKYVGGHSDMLCGILVVPSSRPEWREQLTQDRRVMGCVMGNLEGWLGIRSIRTMHLRVARQSQSATTLVKWLHAESQNPDSLVSKMVETVLHASLQEDALKEGWLQKQMPNGFGAVFGICMKNREHAKRLPSRLFVFQHATSLGGVESLMEWRAMSDLGRDERLLRVSCGIEDVEDLQSDILQAFEGLLRDFP